MFKDDEDDDECKQCIVCNTDLLIEDVSNHIESCIISLNTLHGREISINYLRKKGIIDDTVGEFGSISLIIQFIRSVTPGCSPVHTNNNEDEREDGSNPKNEDEDYFDGDKMILKEPELKTSKNFFDIDTCLEKGEYQDALNRRLDELRKKVFGEGARGRGRDGGQQGNEGGLVYCVYGIIGGVKV